MWQQVQKIFRQSNEIIFYSQSFRCLCLWITFHVAELQESKHGYIIFERLQMYEFGKTVLIVSGTEKERVFIGCIDHLLFYVVIH